MSVDERREQLRAETPPNVWDALELAWKSFKQERTDRVRDVREERVRLAATQRALQAHVARGDGGFRVLDLGKGKRSGTRNKMLHRFTGLRDYDELNAIADAVALPYYAANLHEGDRGPDDWRDVARSLEQGTGLDDGDETVSAAKELTAAVDEKGTGTVEEEEVLGVGRRRALDVVEAVGLVLVRMRLALSYAALAVMYRLSEATVRRTFLCMVPVLAQYFWEAMPVVDADDWASRCPDEIKETAREAVGLSTDDSIAVILADGTYMYMTQSRGFLARRSFYDVGKKRPLLKAHQYTTGDGSRAFFSLAAGSQDDMIMVSKDAVDETSYLRQLVARLEDHNYTVVMLLDGGYWMNDKRMTPLRQHLPNVRLWCKENGKAKRQERAKSIEQKAQMVIRSCIERYNRRGIKEYHLLSNVMNFSLFFMAPDLIAIAVGVHNLRDVSLVRPGVLVRNTFKSVKDEELRVIEQIDNSGNNSFSPYPLAQFGEWFNGTNDLPRRLVDFLSAGSVYGAHRFIAVRWVFDLNAQIGCGPQLDGDGMLCVTGRVQAALKSSQTAHKVMLLVPRGSAFGDVRMRCDCLRGLSGECAHCVALWLGLAKALKPEEYEAAFSKNSDGRHRRTVRRAERVIEAQGGPQPRQEGRALLTRTGMDVTAPTWAKALLQEVAQPARREYVRRSNRKTARGRAMRKRPADAGDGGPMAKRARTVANALGNVYNKVVNLW